MQVVSCILGRAGAYFQWKVAAGTAPLTSDTASCSEVGLLNHVLLFLCGLLRESEVMLRSRPGHEALWYHRRSLVTLLLEVTKAATSTVRRQRDWSALASGSICDKSPGLAIQLSDLDPLSGQGDEAVAEPSVDQFAVRLQQFLTNLLCGEAALCRLCARNGDGNLWGQEDAQRRAALRHSAFTLDTVSSFMCIFVLHCIILSLFYVGCRHCGTSAAQPRWTREYST